MNPSLPHSVSENSSLTTRRIRWLQTFGHTILVRSRDLDGIDPLPVGSVTFEEDSESVVHVHFSRISMPGFGELKANETEHFAFIDSFSN